VASGRTSRERIDLDQEWGLPCAAIAESETLLLDDSPSPGWNLSMADNVPIV